MNNKQAGSVVQGISPCPKELFSEYISGLHTGTKLCSLLNSLQEKDRAKPSPASDGISAESLSEFIRIHCQLSSYDNSWTSCFHSSTSCVTFPCSTAYFLSLKNRQSSHRSSKRLTSIPTTSGTTARYQT